MRLDGVGADSYDLDALWGVVFGEGDERVLEEDDEGTVVALIRVKKNEETERGGKKGWKSEFLTFFPFRLSVSFFLK